MQIFDILIVFMAGGINYISFGNKYINKNVKPTFTISDRERLNNALPVFKFRF
ncbi:MAG TPA: hypothetical protein VK169_12020 [Saprospiraceae bacterium]|jgi:hypothetical protein|nr:hypothetical protein [Saprospiraceae bacterium]